MSRRISLYSCTLGSVQLTLLQSFSHHSKDYYALQSPFRAAIETEWEVIKQNHKEAVAEWGLLCQRLRSNGAKSKELPKKPKCPLKPKLPPVGHLEDDDSDDNEEEEEEE